MATDHNFKVKNGLTVLGDTLVVNHTADVDGTQVYIKKKDSSTNLMRWGEGTSGVTTYKWRIDQSFDFVGSNGSDVIVLKSSDGSIRGQSYKIGTTTIIDSSRNLSNIGTISNNNTITSSIGTTLVGLDITGSSSNYTAATIGNTSSGDAILYLDASNGDFAGSDYASIRQTNALSLVLKTESSGGSIFLQPAGTTALTLNTSQDATFAGTIQNGSVWINDGTNYNNYNENIRLFDPANGASVIAFGATGTGGTPSTSILGYSDRFETRVSSTWRTRVYSSGLYVNGGYYVGTTAVIDSSRNLVNIGTINTGQGATEVHLMNQNVRSSDSPTFADLTVTGNLNITGDINSYNITDLDVVDKTITLGVGGTSNANNGGGIIIDGANAKLTWSDSSSRWTMNKSLQFSDTPTTTNQAMGIFFPGFDKEGTSDYTDNAKIIHTTNTGGHTGSVLLIESQNDANDGIAFVTPSSSRLKHNSNNIFTDAYHPNADTLTTARTIAGTSFDGSANIDISYDNLTNKPSDISNSDTVDGLHAASFLRSDANDVFTAATLSISGSGSSSELNLGTYSSTNQGILYLNGSSANRRSIIKTTNGNLHIDPHSGYGLYLNYYTGNHVYFGSGAGGVVAVMGSDGDLWKGAGDNSGSKYWHAGNDGSGSGLDADLLDGQQGSYYNQSAYTSTGNAAGSYLGGHYSSGGNEKPNSSTFGAGKFKIAMLGSSNLGFGGAWNDVFWNSSYNGSDVKRSTALVSSKYDNTSLWIVKQNYDSSSWGTGYLFWNAGNDGSGSGLDADTLDGVNGASFLRSDAADSFTGTLTGGSGANILLNSNVGDNGTTAFTSMTGRLEFDHDYSDTVRGPNKIVTYEDGSWIAGLGIHSSTASYYSGHTHAWYKSNSSTSFTQNMALNSTGSLSTLAQGTVWGASNDGSGSGLDADTLDGQHASAFLTSFTETNSFIGDGGNASTHPGTSRAIYSGQVSAGSGVLGMPTTNNANSFLNLNKHSGEYNSQLGFSSNGNIYYRNFNNTAINSTATWRTIWDSGNDGSGSGLDADTLDGQHASAFVSTSTTSLSNYMRVNASNNVSSSTYKTRWYSSSQIDTSTGSASSLEVYGNNGAGTDAFMTFHVENDYAVYFGLDGGTNKLSVGGWSLGANSYEIYHSGNKPSLATLGFTGASNANYITNNNQLTNGAGYITSADGGNAATLDGIDSSQFLRSDASDTMSGELNVTRNSGVSGSSAPSYSQANIELQTSSNNVPAISFHRGGYSATTLYEYDGELHVNPWTTRAQAGKLISSGNYDDYVTTSYVNGLGVNATTLDSLDLHTGRNNEANKVVRTDGNGYIQAGWINTTSGSTTTGISRLYASNDGYIRYYTKTNFLNSGGMGEAIFNNMSRSHSTYTDFNSTGLRAGVNYIQGGTNSPTGSGQWYGFRLGLGSDYPTVTGNGSAYSSELYWARIGQVNNKYLWARDMEGGSWGSWRKFWAERADNLQGYSSAENGASTIHRLASNGYSQIQNWQNVAGAGIYSTTVNGAHFYPNTAGSYGTWRINGSRGGYSGIYHNNGGGVVGGMYDSGGNGGDYNGTNGWQWYWHRSNACLAVAGSTTSSSYSLYVGGAIYATQDVVAYSDRRIKENIITIDSALEKVNKLRGVYYNKIDNEDKEREIGFIAQEVNEVAPELVTYAEDVDQYGVKYGNTTALLVEAVKELTQQVKDLKQEIEEMKNVK